MATLNPSILIFLVVLQAFLFNSSTSAQPFRAQHTHQNHPRKNTEDYRQKGLLSIVNKTHSPKIITIKGVEKGTEKFSVKVTLTGNKDYFLEPGLYQITYYALICLQQHTKYFKIWKREKTVVTFYKTAPLKAEFEITHYD